MTPEQANKLIDRWAGDPMVADDEIATAMRLIRAQNVELVAALRRARPFVETLTTHGDAMRKLAEEALVEINTALAATGHKQG